VVATRLAAAQAALGHDVSILSYRFADAEDRVRAAMQGMPGAEGVTIEWVDWPGKLEMVLARAGRARLRAIVPDHDFVHLHGVWEAILTAAGRACERARVPYTQCLHGMLDVWCMEQKRLKKHVALALAIRRTLNRCAFLHALNHYEADVVEPLGLTAPREVIPNGVFPEEFDSLPEPGAFHREHPELQGRPFVLFMSRLHHKKGLDFLADSFARVAAELDEPVLVVAGPDGGARADLERQLSDLGIQDRAFLTGPIYGPEKLAALTNAACFCLPSRQEGFSIAITEALACGTPAVVSAECHYPEVEEAGAGVVAPLDADAIARGLLEVLGSDERREAMGRAGRELVFSRFTWPNIAQRTIDLYQRYSAQTDAALRAATAEVSA